MTNKIVVTGATGFVAKHVRKYISEMNLEFSSISRRDFKAFQNEKKIITTQYDPDVILSQIQNHDIMIHLVGIGRPSFSNDFNSNNFQLTKKLVKLCIKTGIKKFVYLSGLGVSKYSSLEYFLSKYRAEVEIKRSGIDFTIFRPSYIVGKDDLFTKYLKKQIRRGIVTIPGSGRFWLQPILISDATKILFKSLFSKKFSNKTFDLVGPKPITFERYVRQFLNSKVQIKKIPLEDAYRDAIIGKNTDFGVDDLNLLVGSFLGNSKKLETAYGTKLHTV